MYCWIKKHLWQETNIECSQGKCRMRNFRGVILTCLDSEGCIHWHLARTFQSTNVPYLHTHTHTQTHTQALFFSLSIFCRHIQLTVSRWARVGFSHASLPRAHSVQYTAWHGSRAYTQSLGLSAPSGPLTELEWQKHTEERTYIHRLTKDMPGHTNAHRHCI